MKNKTIKNKTIKNKTMKNKTIKNKTIKQRGRGPISIMDDEFIITKFKNIFKLKTQYKFNIVSKIKFNKKFFILTLDEPELIIDSEKYHNKECLKFSVDENENGISVIVWNIFKCAPIENYGNIIIETLKEFAQKCGYYSVIIDADGSTLDFYFDVNGEMENVEIDLFMLSILSSGESWYNRLGFYNNFDIENTEINKQKITYPLYEIDNFVKNNFQKTFYLHNYDQFNILCEYIINLIDVKKTDSVQYICKKISNFIRVNCDTMNKTCKVDYNTIVKINYFLNYMYKILQIKYDGNNLEYIIPFNDNMTVRKGGKKIKKI